MGAADAEKVRRFLTEQRAWQDRLVGELGADHDGVRRNQQLVWGWDFMSLALCLDWAPTTAERIPLGGEPVNVQMERAGELALTLDPWPFEAAAVTVRCEGRELAGGYGSERELHDALAAAPPVTLEWRLSPG
jgi:hypothetical protein